MSTLPVASPTDTPPTHVRVAVAQLDYHPAFVDALFDPLFDLERPASSLLSEEMQSVPKKLHARFNELRQRVRAVYVEQMRRRTEAIVHACRGWKVQLLVFPEYSIPPEVLEPLARAAGDMVLVAGSHQVDYESLDQGRYDHLGATAIPELQEAVSPVLYGGKIRQLVRKLHPSKPELGALKAGVEWSPVELPEGIPGPLGVLICLDYFTREGERHLELVAGQLPDCRLLAAPLLTRPHSLPELLAQARKDARRSRMHPPVLLANIARFGGSTLVVDEGRETDLTLFPEHAGRLEAKEEGVIIADVDLGFQAVGDSTPYLLRPSIVPFAAASLVYRGIDSSYASWLDALWAKLESPGQSDFKKLKAVATFIRETPPPVPGDVSARARRLGRLEQDIGMGMDLSRAEKLSRELDLPEDILPLDALRAALARGAAEEIDRWVTELGAGEFGPSVVRLREAWTKIEPASLSWSPAAQRAAEEVRAAVRGGPKAPDPKALVAFVDVLEEEVERGFEDDNKKAAERFEQGRYVEARELYRQMLDRANDLIAHAKAAERPRLQKWAAKCQINVAACTLNLQEVEEAKDLLEKIDADLLHPKGRLALAEALAFVGEPGQAEALLPGADALEDSELHGRLEEIRQRIAVRRGQIPEELYPSAPLHVDAVMALLAKNDLARAGRLALEVLKAGAHGTHGALTVALATNGLTDALVRTIFENPPDAVQIPVELRGEIIDQLEKSFDALRERELPSSVRSDLDHAEDVFRTVTHDDDHLAERFAARPGDEGEKDSEPRQLALRLAFDSRVEEAFRALPPDPTNHPWHGRLDRVELLTYGQQFDRALDEALSLASDFPGRAPIEHLTAELCGRAGRSEEALNHAERGFKALPGKGYRLQLAGERLGNDQAEGAWELVKDLADDRPRVLRMRALAAEKTGRLDEAQRAWHRYVERRPEDGPAHVRFAQLLFRLHRPEEAAAVAWKAFMEHGERLDLDALYVCGSLQRLAGELDAEQTRRIKEVASKLKERYPADPRAEFSRLQLLMMLGELPADVEPIAYDKMVEAGLLDARPVSELAEFLSQRHALLEAVTHFARLGAIPMTTASMISGTPLALVVARILERSRHAAGLLCPPVPLSDQLPTLKLQGATLLLSDLELLLLEVLELLPALHEALGASGRLVLFRRAQDRIREDFAKLRIEANPKKLAEIEALLRQIERLPALEADPGAPYDDVAAARKAGAAIVSHEAAEGVLSISPRAFLRHLQELGCLDEDQRARIEPYLPSEPEPLPTLPEPLPERIAAPGYLIERFHQANVLAPVLEALQGRLVRGPRVEPYFKAQRDEQADKIRAVALVEKVHRRLAEEWIKEVREPAVSDLPPLREQEEEGWNRELVLEPLQEMLAYRYAVLEHPAWWRLSADFFGTNALGAPGMTNRLAWKNADEFHTLMRRLRPAADRDLTLPVLARLLLVNSKDADQRLLKLAELGFPDALGAEEILRLERRYKGLDKAEPKRILDNQEWMAREPGHLGGDFARLRLAQAYATTLFRAFCNKDGSLATDRPHAERSALCRALLGRQQSIDEKAASNALDQTLQFVALETLSNPLVAWKRREGGYVTDYEGSATALWMTISEWTGRDRARRAAHNRAIREVWLLLDDQRAAGPSLMDALTLDVAHPLKERAHDEAISLVDSAVEALAILSSTWKERPLRQRGAEVEASVAGAAVLINYEQILLHGAAVLAADPSAIEGSRAFDYEVPVAGREGVVSVRAPVEAVFLRADIAARATIAGQLKAHQGIRDGTLYKLLEDIERTPGDAQALRKYARRSVVALFRLVQDDPPFIRNWGQARSVSAHGGRPRLEDLRLILSEPDEPLPDSIRDALMARLGGFWSTREDKGKLFLMASEVPGSLPAAPVPWWLEQAGYERHVEISLERLDHPDESPIARIAGDVIFLRVASARRPLVKLPEGEIDLRELLPGRLERLLEKVMAPPDTDTLGAAEAALLRVSGEVVQRLAAPESLSLREGLWLTYRLFQWLCLQLAAISPDARRDGIRRLVAQAPLPEEPKDVLDPFGFDRDRFDHRLAAVLHALGAMEEIVDVFRQQSDQERAPEPRRVSSPALEDKLLTLARRAHQGPSLGSVLEWNAPGNVPDLALDALLHLSSERFADLSAEARTRRFEALPEDPQALEAADPVAFVFASRVVLAASNVAASLTAPERTALEAKLRAMVDGPSSREWRWTAFVSLFAEGADHLEDEARNLTIEQAGHALAPVAFGSLLLGVARRDPKRVEPVLEAVLAAAVEQKADVVGLALGSLGRLLVHGPPEGQGIARALLLRLAERAPFQDDPRVSEVIGFFGLKEQPQ